jgi:hypothetical protein
VRPATALGSGAQAQLRPPSFTLRPVVDDARTGALLETLAPEPNEADANAGRAVAVSRHRLLVGGSDWSGVGLVGVWAR